MADECSSMEMELDVSEEYLTKTERSGCCPKLAEWIHLHQKQVIVRATLMYIVSRFY